MRSTIQEKSADMRLLEQMLLETPVGATITYSTLRKAFPDRSWTGKDRGFLLRALRNVCRDEAAVFDNVVGVGYRRADDVAKANGTTLGISRARRIMKRHVVERAAAIENIAALPQAVRTVAIVNASIGAALAFATTATTLKKLGASGDGTKVLPPVETLRFLAERTGK